jgi:outer membrane protein assembly factor BamB
MNHVECSRAARVLLALIGTLLCFPAALTADNTREILQTAGMRGGLVVAVECDDTELLSRLAEMPGVVLQNLDRADLERRNGQLPYIDNLANAVILSDTVAVTEAELLRVLVPGGTALLGGAEGYRRMVKPRSARTDEWTHFLHGPGNNPVARDFEVDSPGGLQWIDTPLWTRDHDSTPTIFGLVSAGGRLFYILDEGPIGIIDSRLPSSHCLIARDAYNGVLLWKHRLPDWYPSHHQWGTVPVHVHRRLVAVGNRVYVTEGLRGPVVALDAATGEKLRSYEGSDESAEILVAEGFLIAGIMPTPARPGDEYPSRRDQAFRRARLRGYQERGKGVAVYEAETGKRKWSRARQFVPSTLAADGEHLFYATDQRLVCVHLASGDTVWESPGSASKLIVHDGVVVTAGETAARRWTPGVALQARSAADGRLLWEADGKSLPTFANCFYIPPEILIAQGLLWIQANKADAVVGLDLRTGERRRSVSTQGGFTPGHHVRCYPAKGTEDFALLNKRGIEFMDFRGEQGLVKHDWIRGICRLGIVPCNGMIYAPPNGCNCCVETYLRGFLALNSRTPPDPLDDARRLHQGPVYRQPASMSPSDPIATSDSAGDGTWPAFRHDSMRTCRAGGTVETPLEGIWQKKFAGPVTPPTVAGRRVFVSEIDAHEVHCLDAATGTSQWSFVAGGRVDSPPTLARGWAVFGAADGCVYCLRAEDGQLAWRFQAAPLDRRLVAFGQVESLWPCHGSVLIQNGVVYATAGRSSYLDGGIVLYGLDLQTGDIRCRHSIHTRQPQQTTRNDTFNNRGALTDILVSDGEYLFMRHLKFDRQLRRLSPLYPLTEENRAARPRVMATAGFLDDSGCKRVYRAVGERWTGRYSALRTQQLALGDAVSYGSRIHFGRGWKSPRYHPGDGSLVFAQDHADAARIPRDHTDEAAIQGNSGRWNFEIPRQSYRWQQQMPVYVQAIVLAGDRLLVAGRADRDVDDTIELIKGRAAGQLWLLSADEGKIQHRLHLPAAPILDGVAVAHRRVFLSTEGNHLVCLGNATD